jgi:arylsulfatase A-like enzyme
MANAIRLLTATLFLGLVLAIPACNAGESQLPSRPNIVLIYADDLGYGDVSSYGATAIQTPNIDRIAAEGLRFTNAHAPAATCTPSRYAMLTGEYAWRRPGTGIARGDAPLIIPTRYTTLPALLKRAGYATAVIGKWHLGLGPDTGPDWNGELTPGPLEIGFDYAYLMPATGDRVPTVYVENHRVVGLDPADPIQVSFSGPIGAEPTGAEHPELLRIRPSHGHDQTIVNGISRIGYMAGGRAARWVDEDMADAFAARAVRYIEEHRDGPFFLYFSTHDIHVPRTPHPRFANMSGLGPRGDATLQLDWSVGQILGALDRLGLTPDTLVLFTSDNGPVLDDGYIDQAVELVGDHDPAGGLRGGKYSAFEAGTRVPFIVRWPRRINPGVSGALVSQIDFPASWASLVGVSLSEEVAPDSHDVLAALLGDSPEGRDHLVEQAGPLSIIRGRWKLIEARDGPAVNRQVNIELGNASDVQLYDLDADPAERTNVAVSHPDVVEELSALLQAIREQGRSR